MTPRPARPATAVAPSLACLILVAAAVAGCSSADLARRVRLDHDAGAAVVDPDARSPSLAAQAGPQAAGSADDATRRASSQSARPVLGHARAPWIGSVSVPMPRGDRLPTVFTEPVRLNFEDAATGGTVPLRTVADRLVVATGIAVRLKPDVFSVPVAAPSSAATNALPPGDARHLAGGSPGAPAPVPLPSLQGPGLPPGAAGAPLAWLPVSPNVAPPAGVRPGGPPIEPSVHAVAMRWSGTLEGYLDLVTYQLGLSWAYRDGAVVIERFRTEFFEVAALDGETDFHLGLSGADPAMSSGGGASGGAGAGGGGGGGGGGGEGANDVAEHGRANPIGSILAAVQQMIRDVPGSSVVRTEGSGRLAVTTTREAMSQVREFIRAENESLLRQAQVQFDIYSVTRQESDERGIEWNAVLSALGGAYVATVGSPATLASTTAGNLGFTILTPAQSGVTTSVTEHLGGSSALLKLLSQYGVATQHRQVSLLALNRTWDRKSSLGGRAYVSATVPGAATTAGVGAPGLVTSTVTTGDRYLAQPFILDNDTVLLKFGIGLSSLVNLVNFTSGTGLAQQTVQTPETTAINDQATVALKAGQVLVITGLSRAVANDDRRTLSEDAPVGLGGSRAQSRLREDFVIFVRPTLL